MHPVVAAWLALGLYAAPAHADEFAVEDAPTLAETKEALWQFVDEARASQDGIYKYVSALREQTEKEGRYELAWGLDAQPPSSG